MSDDAIDLNALERLARAATPGPWSQRTLYTDRRPKERYGVRAGSQGDHDAPMLIPFRSDGSGLCYADSEFIAEARTALPRLVARVRELELAISGLRETLTK